MNRNLHKLIIYCAVFLLPLAALGQKKDPELIYINKDVSTHFISPEPIQYVDISTDGIAGDIPVANILRVKPKEAGAASGIVTIVGERFMVQYKLSYTPTTRQAHSEVRIDPTQVDEYLNPDVSMSRLDMQQFALTAVKKSPRVHGIYSRNQKMELRLNNIYTVGDYFFVDVSMKNRSNIRYDIDQIRFKIEDKKVVKATNFQQLEVTPAFHLYETDSFSRRYRNVFVFKKFTFPDDKVFNIEVSEDQVSGRTISLKINYKDVLRADTL